jgi:hypothetical protein
MRCDSMRWRPDTFTTARLPKWTAFPAGPCLAEPGPEHLPTGPHLAAVIRRRRLADQHIRRTARFFQADVGIFDIGCRRVVFQFDQLAIEGGNRGVEYLLAALDIDTLTNLKIGLGHALRQHALATSLVDGRIDVVDLGQRIFSTQAQQKNKKNTQNCLHEDPRLPR